MFESFVESLNPVLDTTMTVRKSAGCLMSIILVRIFRHGFKFRTNVSSVAGVLHGTSEWRLAIFSSDTS